MSGLLRRLRPGRRGPVLVPPTLQPWVSPRQDVSIRRALAGDLDTPPPDARSGPIVLEMIPAPLWSRVINRALDAVFRRTGYWTATGGRESWPRSSSFEVGFEVAVSLPDVYVSARAGRDRRWSWHLQRWPQS